MGRPGRALREDALKRQRCNTALHAGGAAPAWSPDLDAKTQEQPRHPPAPPPHTHRVLFGPPRRRGSPEQAGNRTGLGICCLLPPPCRACGPGGLVPSSPPSPHPGRHLHAQGQASAGVTEPYTSGGWDLCRWREGRPNRASMSRSDKLGVGQGTAGGHQGTGGRW